MATTTWPHQFVDVDARDGTDDQMGRAQGAAQRLMVPITNQPEQGVCFGCTFPAFTGI